MLYNLNTLLANHYTNEGGLIILTVKTFTQ